MSNTPIRVICPNKRKIPIAAIRKRDTIKRIITVITATMTMERIFIL